MDNNYILNVFQEKLVHFKTGIKKQIKTGTVVIFPFIVSHLIIKVGFVVDSSTYIKNMKFRAIIMFDEISYLSNTVSIPFLEVFTRRETHCKYSRSYSCNVQVELLIHYSISLPRYLFSYYIFYKFHFKIIIKSKYLCFKV